MKSKATLALFIITTSLSAKGKVNYDDYHNIDTGIVGETQGVFKVKVESLLCLSLSSF